MDKKSDASFSRFSIEISQSAQFIDQTIDGQSPIYNYLTTSHHPTTKELFCIQQERSQEMSIQDDINSFSNPYSLYKCYKCYGVQNRSNLRYTLPLCDECEGSEYIPQTNPLVSLLQKVLKKKIPQLLKKEDKSSLQNYGNRVICGFCEKENCKQESYICQECKDYHLCSTCFESKSFIHKEGHHFCKFPTEYSLKSRQTLQNMKKISEDYERQEEFYNEEQDMRCTLCDQELQGCYQSCSTCELQSKKYSVCSKCSQSYKFEHIPDHHLQLRTSKMQSKLPQLFAKPSASSSTCTNFKEIEENENISSPHINRQLTKSTARSMVFFPHLELDQSNEMPQQYQNNLRTSQTEIVWSPNYQNTQSQSEFMEESNFNPQSSFAFAVNKKDQKQHTGLVLRSGSMVSIKMEESEDPSQDFHSHCFLEPKQDIPQLTAFTFGNSQKTRTQLVARPQQKKDEQQDYIFTNYQCDMCLTQSIKNIRHHCKQCPDYDLCHECYLTRAKNHEHQNFQEIDGRALKRDRMLKFTKLKQSSVRQTYVPLRKSTVNFSLVRSRAF